MKTRYIKIIRDLTSDYSKNLMLVLAVAIGVFGIGSILGGYTVIKREMTANYTGTIPASATIEVEKDISIELVDSLKKLPGVKEVERHATVVARMKVGDQWHPLLLFVIDDFENKRTNKITHISGATKPSVGAMLTERTALVVMEANEGDEILVKTPQGEPRKIKLSGVVHDAGLAPAWQEQGGYGYITLSTLHWLGEAHGFDQLRILVSDQQDNRQHILERATAVADWLNINGYHVHEIQVPPPGRHPHQSQMDAVMSIFTLFSFLILILGSILVSGSMATMMVRQVRQIGIMKTIGANSSQISVLYLLFIVIICAIALLVSIPFSRLTASGFYQQIAALLNLKIRDTSIPLWVPLIQVSSGIIIPLIAAAFPVVRGSRISVRLALDNYGVSPKNLSENSWVMKLSRLAFLGQAFLLSIRNVFRQRQRLVMTLGLLAAGGAIFMTALNVSEAWNENLKRIYSQRLYDLEVRLNDVVPLDSALHSLRDISGISTIEGWSYSSTSFAGEKGYEIAHTYPDKGHGSFIMQAVPANTKLLNPTVTEGQWLEGNKTNGIVLNQLARGLSSGIGIGDHISLSLAGHGTDWEVVGFTQDVGASATGYVLLNDFWEQTGTRGNVKMIRTAYLDRSRENVIKKNQEVEQALGHSNISVSAAIPVWLLHNAIAAHMKVLVNSLLAMAILMGIVGTLGLMSSMSMNVLERTREIGVMRAIGATPAKIRALVTWEGFTVGTLSILIALALSLIISFYFGRFIGNMAFRTPLTLTISLMGLALWVLIVLAGSYVATYFPASRANRITTREALAYE